MAVERSTSATGFPARSRNPSIDRHIGARIRERRTMLGMSQQELASSIGLTSQQIIYKYEMAKSSTSARTLYEIARSLDVSVGYLFEGLDDGALGLMPVNRRLLEFMRCLEDIKDAAHVAALAELVRTLAGGS